jgi:hypothetical protein
MIIILFSNTRGKVCLLVSWKVVLTTEKVHMRQGYSSFVVGHWCLRLWCQELLCSSHDHRKGKPRIKVNMLRMTRQTDGCTWVRNDLTGPLNYFNPRFHAMCGNIFYIVYPVLNWLSVACRWKILIRNIFLLNLAMSVKTIC